MESFCGAANIRFSIRGNGIKLLEPLCGPELRIGTSTFTAAGWPGTFYPECLPECEYLTYHPTKFGANGCHV
jgi:hypothetical protein